MSGYKVRTEVRLKSHSDSQLGTTRVCPHPPPLHRHTHLMLLPDGGGGGDGEDVDVVPCQGAAQQLLLAELGPTGILLDGLQVLLEVAAKKKETGLPQVSKVKKDKH